MFHVKRCRRWRCPACGWFGRRARRRNQAAEDQAHIRWAAQLAEQTRKHNHLADAIARKRVEIEAAGVSLTERRPVNPWAGFGIMALHSHTADEPCQASCTVYDRTDR